MDFRIQDQGKEVLASAYSHLLIERLGEGDTGLTIRQYLDQRKVPVVKELTLLDDQGRNWLVYSISLPDISQMVLELIEKGMGTNIQGINAKPVNFSIKTE